MIFERAHFNRHIQQEGESAGDYITALHQLADTCEYGVIKAEMIRDRLVVGIRDESLSERLQMEADLDLEKAKKLVRQSEAVQQQHGLLKVVTKRWSQRSKVRLAIQFKEEYYPTVNRRRESQFHQYLVQNCADGVEKLHTQNNRVQPEMQSAFDATEKAILELSAYRQQ